MNSLISSGGGPLSAFPVDPVAKELAVGPSELVS
jgi:hypothetical protein